MGEFGKFVWPQQPGKTKRDAELVRSNVILVQLKNYIESGPVDSFIHYFYMSKGLKDICMVYNGTRSGQSNAAWAPHFGLLYVTHTIRSLMPGYCQCDHYIGEMFLNFLLHKGLQQLLEVDISHVHSTDPMHMVLEGGRQARWERWCRNWMGLSDRSPNGRLVDETPMRRRSGSMPLLHQDYLWTSPSSSRSRLTLFCQWW